MALIVKIKKFKKENDDISYEIFSLDGKSKLLFMKINKKSKTIFFSFDKNFCTTIKTIELSDQNKAIGSLPNVPQVIFIKAIFQAMKAIKKNTLLSDLSYYS